MDLTQLKGEHKTLRYMTRFGCIGPDCEDNCCYGWRVDVNPAIYRKLMTAAQFSAKPLRVKLATAIKVVPPKKKTERPRYLMKHRDDTLCDMLDEQLLCEIHKQFGHTMLPDVCAIYPRKLKRVGDHVELTATGSCPEAARQILLHADGVDEVPLELSSIERMRLQDGMDTRDTRPYYRSMIQVRDFVTGLLRAPDLTTEQKLFLMAWFSKRTADILAVDRTKADMAPVHREMAALRKPAIQAEICRRFDHLEAPKALSLLIARAVVAPGRKHQRKAWQKLVDETVGSYVKLKEILPDSDDEAVHEAAAEVESEQIDMTIPEVWDEYRQRRDRIRDRFGDRMDQYLLNYTIHTWVHRMAVEAKDVMVYTMRILAQQAASKFLIYSHPTVHAALDAAESMSDEEGDAHVIEALDAVAVSVHYQVARHVEHGTIIKWLETLLKKQNMYSMAGAVYLIRF